MTGDENDEQHYLSKHGESHPIALYLQSVMTPDDAILCILYLSIYDSLEIRTNQYEYGMNIEHQKAYTIYSSSCGVALALLSRSTLVPPVHVIFTYLSTCTLELATTSASGLRIRSSESFSSCVEIFGCNKYYTT